MKVSLILPVLNREDRLEEVLREIRSKLASLDPEVIVVYDVTRPEMLAEVEAEQEAIRERYGASSVTRLAERGFGSALRAGFRAASGDAIVPVMADCSDDIAALPRMLAEIEAGADIAVGCRYMAGGGIVGDDLKQRISRFYSMLMRAVSGLRCRDVSNSFKAYRREVWEAIEGEAESFDVSVEMTVKAAAAGYRIADVPAVWTNRQAGRSQFNMRRELPNYGRWLLYAARRMPSRPLLAGAALVAAASLAVLVLGGGRGEGARRA
jgi:glycosyltransferase involved in cell wall biosynthesis